MIPRFGNAPRANKKYTLRPGAYAILPRGKDVLLTVQLDEAPDFQLPGGGIDPGESPLQALHREVREETGWRISKPRLLGRFRRFVFMPEYDLWAEKLCSIYWALPVYPLYEPSEPDHEAVWVNASDAVEILGSPGDAALMRRHLRP